MKALVVDSTELFDEILERVRSSRDFRLIDAAHAGRIRLFAADHVATEVPAKISENFSRRRASPEEGHRIWRNDYLPYIHFVDTEGLPMESRELDLLSERDPSDIAQARLTTLMSPVLSVSSDKDLVEHGFATKSRWAITRSTQSQLEAEARYMAVALPGGLMWAGFDSAFRSAGTSWGKPGKLLVVAATVGGIWFLVRTVKKSDPGTRAKLLIAAETLMRLLADATERHQGAEHRLTQALIDAPGMQQRLVADIAAQLATATEPLTATQISRDLWAEGSPIPRLFFNEVQQELSCLPAFVRSGKHGWQLGRTVVML